MLLKVLWKIGHLKGDLKSLGISSVESQGQIYGFQKSQSHLLCRYF